MSRNSRLPARAHAEQGAWRLPSSWQWWSVVAIGILLAVLLLFGPIRREFDGLVLVVRAADLGGRVRWLADRYAVPVTTRTTSIPTSEGPIPARIFEPRGHARQTVLLTAGLHAAGLDEPRLFALATRLAEAGVVVVTPGIPELARLEITPRLTDRIEASAVWLATRSGLAPEGRIGMMGVSFSGGLSIVAAGRPSLEGRLLYVFSLGGHHDLVQVLEYLSAGVEHGERRRGPGPDPPPPHDYGVAVALLNVADHLVPPEQLTALQDAVSRFLHASYLDVVDPPRGQREFAAIRELTGRMPEPSRTLLGYVNDRDVASLGPLLLPHLRSHASPPALSPSRSPLPRIPVFLLHGEDDNVIPARESQALADQLRDARGDVNCLLTGLITHVDAGEAPRLPDLWRLGAFWGQILSQ